MFATQVKKTIEVPGDDNDVITVTIRKLSYRILKAAYEFKQSSTIKSTKEYGSDLIKAFREMPAATAAVTPDPLKARYGSYDVDQILEKGIVEWTATAKLPEAIQDLDEATATKLFREILDFSLPPIEEDEAEAQQGKSSGRSTST